ncbi:MAG TPA: hypothetical protein VFO07_00670, partial [Roseiflexaceae bacterium]|nr:hypothetical protein [Roseiflexaceae bacterium]
MNDDKVQILLIEDDTAHAELIERAFELQGDRARLNFVRSLAEARAYLERQLSPPDLIIADWRLPDGESLELLASASG